MGFDIPYAITDDRSEFIPPIGGTGFGGGSELHVLLGFKNKRDLKIYTPDLRNECCGGTRCNVWCRGAAVAVAETEVEAEAEAKAEAESEAELRLRLRPRVS